MTVEPANDADIKVSTASNDDTKQQSQQQQQQQQQSSPSPLQSQQQSQSFQLPNFSVPPPKLNFPPPKPTGQPPSTIAALSATSRSYYFRPQAPRSSGPPPIIQQQSPAATIQTVPVSGTNNALLTNPDDFDGKRLRKSVMRKTVDYNSSIVRCLENRIWQRDWRDRRALQPDVLYYPDLMPPPSYIDNPTNAITTRFVKTATNKIRCPIFCMAWTPEGRRLITGASSGEFTLWNGLTFNFETILQAHDAPVRAMVWSHNDNWMVTGDHTGYVKYWQSNMNNVKMFMAHKEALRGLSFSPSDTKFVTCSDDGTLRLWDFLTCAEERVLRGHGADVKCTQWHPQKALIASGSKDNQQPIKLWDPRTGKAVTTVHAHKATVMDLKWNENGNWLVTASRDHLLKLFDLRKLHEEMQTFRGHKKEASVVAWHPVHEGLFTSGGSDGSVMFWQVDCDKELGAIEQAHDSIVWTMAWHPLGHILCTGSNDHTSKFWTRNRPGDPMRDKYNMNMQNTGVVNQSGAGLIDEMISGSTADDDTIESKKLIPGMDMATARRTDENQGRDRDSSERSFRSDENDDYDDDANYRSRKMPYCKPIPRNFLANWNDTRDCGPLADIMFNDRHSNGHRTSHHNSEILPAHELHPTQLIVYGTRIRVYPNSRLCKAIQDGADSLIKMLLSGDIDEVTHLLPFPDSPNEISCRRNKLMMASVSSQPPLQPLQSSQSQPMPLQQQQQQQQPPPLSSQLVDDSNPWAIKPPLNFVGGSTQCGGGSLVSTNVNNDEDFRFKKDFHKSFVPFPFPGSGNVPNPQHQQPPSHRSHHNPY